MRYYHKLSLVILISLLLLSGCGPSSHDFVRTTDSTKPEAVAEQTDSTKQATATEQTNSTDLLTESEYTESTEAPATLETAKEITLSRSSLKIEDIPAYDDAPYVEVKGNQPEFTAQEKAWTEPFEEYSVMDNLGRCGAAYANVCPELQPTEERGPIGPIQPSGWQTVKYNDLIDGNYLYNRCHLIGYQLAGENSNERNLITGTRYLNMVSMLTFENMVSSYIAATGNHVLYRVTPVFEGDNLVASGVQMEGWSVEDGGKGICFNVYCYNVQPGIVIDYQTGDSHEDPQAFRLYALEADESQNADAVSRLISETEVENETIDQSETGAAESEAEIVKNPTSEDQVSVFILNTSKKRIHLPNCKSIDQMAEPNKQEYTGTIGDLRKEGYRPCQICLKRFPKEKAE